MIFLIFRARNFVSMRKRAHIALLQNSAGRPKPCGAKFAFNLCPAEFLTPQSVLHGVLDPSKCAFGVLEQCNMCPAFSGRHSHRA